MIQISLDVSTDLYLKLEKQSTSFGAFTKKQIEIGECFADEITAISLYPSGRA